MKNNGDANSVVLQRLESGKWTKLSTKQVGEDANSLMFAAISPGLSYYAITVEKKVTTNTAKTSTTTATNSAEAKKEVQQGSSTATENTTDYKTLIAAGLFGLILVGVIGGFMFSKFKKKSEHYVHHHKHQEHHAHHNKHQEHHKK